MKKIVLFVFIVMSGFIQSQNSIISLKGGVSFANVSGDNTNDVSGRTAFHTGISFELLLKQKFSIQPEILYSSQGFKQKIDGKEIVVRYNYLNIPLMAEFYVNKDFTVEVGPQFGVLLSALGSSDSSNDTNVTAFAKKTDFGLNFGFGSKFEKGLNFGFRYNLGLSNINNENRTVDNNQNSVFQIYLAIPISKK